MLVIGGDSFSSITNHSLWYDFLFDKKMFKQKINLARESAGNFYISDSIQNFVKNNHKSIKKVCIFWSQFHRLDLLVDKPFDKFHTYNGRGCWQFCGGLDTKSKKWKSLFESEIKKNSWEGLIQKSLECVENTHKILDDLNINYHFGFVFDDKNNQKFLHHKRYIPTIFSNFIKNHNLFGLDNYHPSEQGHKLFAKHIEKFIS